jgi:hypothetical protein
MAASWSAAVETVTWHLGDAPDHSGLTGRASAGFPTGRKMARVTGRKPAVIGNGAGASRSAARMRCCSTIAVQRSRVIGANTNKPACRQELMPTCQQPARRIAHVAAGDQLELTDVACAEFTLPQQNSGYRIDPDRGRSRQAESRGQPRISARRSGARRLPPVQPR